MNVLRSTINSIHSFIKNTTATNTWKYQTILTMNIRPSTSPKQLQQLHNRIQTVTKSVTCKISYPGMTDTFTHPLMSTLSKCYSLQHHDNVYCLHAKHILQESYNHIKYYTTKLLTLSKAASSNQYS